MQNGSVTRDGYLGSDGQLDSAIRFHCRHNVQEIGVRIVEVWTDSPQEG